MFGLGPIEMLIVGVIAVLLFGNRLPEVGRSVGRSLMEFKKGMRDIQNEVDSAVNPPVHSQISRAARTIDESEEPTAPKFEPPAREPHDPVAHDPKSTRESVIDLHDPESGESTSRHTTDAAV